MVKSINRSVRGSMRLSVDLGDLAEGCKTGDSISVSGICLTAIEIAGNIADFDVSSETIAKSTISKWQSGALVNIEKSLVADGRLGGHFVLGHVDGTAEIKRIENKGEFADITFAADKGLIEGMIIKGSVAVDGMSLTIVKLNKDNFTVSLIPQTLNRTTLGKLKAGDKVNIETDLIVKTVKKYMEQFLPKQGFTIEKLHELGF